MKHEIEYNGLSPHNGEYWYKCKLCGKSDWIASYGTLDQLNFYNKECINDKSNNLKPNIPK